MRDFLAHRVAATPGRTALIDGHGTETWTYAELDVAVDDLATRLAGLGVGAGDRVGLLAATSVASVRAIHAVFRTGGTLVPLNVRLTPNELDRQATVADLDALVCTDETAPTAAELDSEIPTVSLDRERDEPDLTESGSVSIESPESERHDPMVVLFTSGTTGAPKPVPLTSSNLLASAGASAVRLGVLPGDRWLLCLPIYHMGGLAPVLRSTLYGTAVVVREGFDAEGVPTASREFEATGISLVPTQLRRILDSEAALADSLRFVLLGGAPATDELIAECADRDIPVHPTYGTTETASQVATARPNEAFEHDGTVGQPLVGTRVTVVDDGGDALPRGETGEIVVSGPTVTPGYLGDVESPFGQHGLHTGDVGYRDEAGRLWVLGRLDDTIVTGGENVVPGEVERTLRDHPAVREAAVVGLPDAEWGERVAALVVRTDDVTVDDLVGFCRDRLAAYKRPRTIGFTDAIPRTPSGTVDRQAVRDELADA